MTQWCSGILCGFLCLILLGFFRCCVFTFCPKTHYLSQKFAIPFAVFNLFSILKDARSKQPIGVVIIICDLSKPRPPSLVYIIYASLDLILITIWKPCSPTNDAKTPVFCRLSIGQCDLYRLMWLWLNKTIRHTKILRLGMTHSS